MLSISDARGAHLPYESLAYIWGHAERPREGPATSDYCINHQVCKTAVSACPKTCYAPTEGCGSSTAADRKRIAPLLRKAPTRAQRWGERKKS